MEGGSGADSDPDLFLNSKRDINGCFEVYSQLASRKFSFHDVSTRDNVTIFSKLIKYTCTSTYSTEYIVAIQVLFWFVHFSDFHFPRRRDHIL